MTRLTNEHRADIVKGMMRKTRYKKRFDAEIKALGVVVQRLHRAWMVEQYGQSLVTYIDRMDKGHRSVLCHEEEAVDFSWRNRQLSDMAPALFEVLGGYDGRTPVLEDFRHYVGGLIGRNVLVSVRMSKPAWVPRNGKSLFLVDDAALHDLSVTQLAAKLAKLKELLPEAAEFVTVASHPIAIIPNAGGALAALTRAGYFDEVSA